MSSQARLITAPSRLPIRTFLSPTPLKPCRKGRVGRNRQNYPSSQSSSGRVREAGDHTRYVRAWLTRGADRERTRFQVEEDDRLYDEVTEDQYKSVVRGRLAQDDFVVDDGVGGYMDTGVDDFEEPEADEESEEERSKSKGMRFPDIFTACAQHPAVE